MDLLWVETFAGDSMRRLKHRAQFLQAARGLKSVRRGFVLQAIKCDEAEPGIGFTVTKRVGNSPERNRIKRRLRALSEKTAQKFQPNFNYVLIGRREALHEPFSLLEEGLGQAIEKMHNPRKPRVDLRERKAKS
ncbi:MAG: ribonuclease P protein component [Maritalea sp.]|jgi:ribonuclease P protein component